jgi:hypothetical protein
LDHWDPFQIVTGTSIGSFPNKLRVSIIFHNLFDAPCWLEKRDRAQHFLVSLSGARLGLLGILGNLTVRFAVLRIIGTIKFALNFQILEWVLLQGTSLYHPICSIF